MASNLGMVPLIINPIYTLDSGYLLGISPSKGLQQETARVHFKGTLPVFPMEYSLGILPAYLWNIPLTIHENLLLKEWIFSLGDLGKPDVFLQGLAKSLIHNMHMHPKSAV